MLTSVGITASIAFAILLAIGGAAGNGENALSAVEALSAWLTSFAPLTGDRFAAGRITPALKRVTDLLLGVAMLAMIIPLLALVALAIKIGTPRNWRKSFAAT